MWKYSTPGTNLSLGGGTARPIKWGSSKVPRWHSGLGLGRTRPRYRREIRFPRTSAARVLAGGSALWGADIPRTSAAHTLRGVGGVLGPAQFAPGGVNFFAWQTFSSPLWEDNQSPPPVDIFAGYWQTALSPATGRRRSRLPPTHQPPAQPGGSGGDGHAAPSSRTAVTSAYFFGVFRARAPPAQPPARGVHTPRYPESQPSYQERRNGSPWGGIGDTCESFT